MDKVEKLEKIGGQQVQYQQLQAKQLHLDLQETGKPEQGRNFKAIAVQASSLKSQSGTSGSVTHKILAGKRQSSKPVLKQQTSQQDGVFSLNN
jgi:hypothetical protein